jgi:hypothetical protein
MYNQKEAEDQTNGDHVNSKWVDCNIDKKNTLYIENTCLLSNLKSKYLGEPRAPFAERFVVIQTL